MIAALLLIAAITGNVIGPDGAPVPKARVVAYRAETDLDKLRRESSKKERPILGAATTDDKGAFKLDAPDGIVEVHVEAAGFNAEPVLVPADVRSPRIEVRGKVADSSDKPVAHATVVAEGIAVARDGRTLTGHAVARDAAGRVIASADDAAGDGTSRLALAPGEYRFSASAEGYGSETVRASVPSNEVRIALPRGGRLLLRSNEDVHGTARLLLPDGDVYVRCWCNGAGDIEIDGRLTTVDVVSPGSYTLEVTPLGGKPRRYPVTVIQNETVTVQID